MITLSDDLEAIAQEVVRGGFINRVHIGLDYFDASINRVAAWVIGTRNMQKALLETLLEPLGQLRQLERDGDFTSRTGIAGRIKDAALRRCLGLFLPAAGSTGGL